MSHIARVPGISVGHATDERARTGCTIVIGPFRGACEIRGHATGTRELDTLSPTHVAPRADAILLTGGSAFGLAAAVGVAEWLEERGFGFDTGVARIPIVPAAVIYDLEEGSSERRPDAAMGRAACESAVAEGSEGENEGLVGAGAGATVGKAAGREAAMAGGVGSWAVEIGGCTVGALAVVNAFGDVLDERGEILAGARSDGGGFIDLRRSLRSGEALRDWADAPPPGTNTTLAVVATDAPLDSAALHMLARSAGVALARRIAPVHTAFDGDVTFAVSTAEDGYENDQALLLTLGEAAAHCLELAIERAVTIR